VGTVRLHVVVDKTGAVAKVEVLSGHPLLTGTVRDNLRSWKFAPLAATEPEFDLNCEFVLRDKPDYKLNEEISFPSPQRVLIVASPPVIQPTYSSKHG